MTLAGLAARDEDISVLPDMEGIRVSFKLADMPRRASARFPARLTVSTNSGSDDYPIRFTGQRGFGAGECGVEALGSMTLVYEQDGPPRIFGVSPEAIDRCAANAIFFISGVDLVNPKGKAAPEVLWDGRIAGSVDRKLANGKGVRVTFESADGRPLVPPDRGIVPVTLATEEGFAEMHIGAVGGQQCGVVSADGIKLNTTQKFYVDGSSTAFALEATPGFIRPGFQDMELFLGFATQDSSPVSYKSIGKLDENNEVRFGKGKNGRDLIKPASGVKYSVLSPEENGRGYRVKIDYIDRKNDKPVSQTSNLFYRYKTDAKVIARHDAQTKTIAKSRLAGPDTMVTLVFDYTPNVHLALGLDPASIGLTGKTDTPGKFDKYFELSSAECDIRGSGTPLQNYRCAFDLTVKTKPGSYVADRTAGDIKLTFTPSDNRFKVDGPVTLKKL